jgi:chemotaxis protein histidine kinase CheA
MSDADAQAKLHSKLKQLGGRFVQRTIDELNLMHTYLQQARAGDSEAAQQLLLTAHRINGSGAMLGFALVSECARAVERILREDPRASDAWQQIELQLQRLDTAVKEAQRTVEP